MTGSGLTLHDAHRTRGGIATVLVILSSVLALAILDGPEVGSLPSARGEGTTGSGPTATTAGDATDGGADALIVPTIGLSAAMIDIQLATDGVLTPPSDYTEVGYWDGSAEPGAATGQTVVTGHTVHTGGGVMNRLADVAEGDPLQIRYDGELVDYRVRKVEVLTKAEVAEQAENLFGQQRRDGRLVLVTCTEWDGADYQSNIVVFADPYVPI